MQHDKMKDKIFLRDDPKLSIAERKEIEQHLTSCRECQQEVAHWEQIRKNLPALYEINETDAFVDHTMALIYAEKFNKENSSQPEYFVWFPRWALWSASTAVFVFGIGLWIYLILFSSAMMPDELQVSDWDNDSSLQIVLNTEEPLNDDLLLALTLEGP